MPPQPPGVWNSVYNRHKWIDAKGPNRYRRAIYTFVKRTSGYPSFLIFDGSDHTTSLPRHIPTNTPLQALVTLNDPVYDEAAAALAKRTMKEFRNHAGSDPNNTSLDARLRYEARLVLSREPSSQELGALRRFVAKTLKSPQGAVLKQASLKTEAIERVETQDSQKTLEVPKAVGGVLLNLDAAVTR
jgi:Protein of unknown function (DUF1553)